MKKSARSRKRRQHSHFNQVKLGIIVLGCLLSLVIFGKLLDILGILTGPLSADSPKISKISIWDGESVANVIIKSDNVYFLSYNPMKKTVWILKIPDDIQILVPASFGFWPLGSVYGLGQAENPKIGANLLKITASSMFGIAVDGYIIMENGLKPFDKIIDEVRQNPLKIFSLLGHIKTDLSFSEYLQLLWQIRGVRFDKIYNGTFGPQLSSSKIMPDGSKTLEIDSQKTDRFLQPQLENLKIKDEGLGVGIYNTTDHPGLAERAARIITNMGGRVVFTANSGADLKTTIVLGDKSYTASNLIRIFAPACLKDQFLCKNNKQNLETGRAEINIYLGEDYFLGYNTR